MRIGIGLLCLFILIISTFAYAVTGTNNSTSDTYNSIVTENSTELYLMAKPNNNSADYLIKSIGSGNYIEYIGPGAQLSIPLNLTIELTAYVINNEPKDVTPRVIAYQGIVDPDNTLNLTILYNSTATKPINAGKASEYLLNVTPAYISEKSFIGIALIDASGNNLTLLNMTSINASVY